MIPVGKLLLAAFTSVTAFGLWRLIQFVYPLFTSPIRNLRGPKGTSWIYGNMRDIFNAEDSALHEEWAEQYGNTLTFKGLFCTNWLFTMDMRAITHIVTHDNDYHKPLQDNYILSQVFGKSVLFVEGDQHRRQRRVMNPAFGPVHIRALTDIFHTKAFRLRDVWSSEIAKDPAGTTTGIRLDVMIWMSRLTFDVISLAGFNCDFDSLDANKKPNELNEAFDTMRAVEEHLSLIPRLQAAFPPLRLIPTDRARRVKASQRTMARVGKELLSSAKEAARANATEKGDIEKNSLRGRDLLSLLVKANMATDIPENQRLSDEDVLAQVSTFLIAGHETTSLAATWALFAMTNAPEVQTKLREEVLSVDTETPSMDELMALPYLDAIVKETLRVYSPVPNTLRIATKDDVLPVEQPFTDKHGVVHNSINVSKGDSILVPIQAINLSRRLWGPDAHEFKPERWTKVPEGASQIPGVWGHLMTFLGGPRACIGWRFSVVETKALLFTIVRAFEFKPAVASSEIGKESMMVQRPVLRRDPKSGPQLPLFIKPYKPVEI